MQRIAFFLLLILAFFTQALAESATDDAYAKNILFSDIHVQPASPSGGGELFVTGKVTNNGGKNVTGLKVSLVVGRRGMTVSRDFFIVQNGSTGVPLDARQALEAHDSRSFSATLAGFSRTQGARIEIESLFTEEAQLREPQQRADSGSAAWLLLGFVIAVGAALIIFYILPSQRQARLQRAQEDAAQAQQAAEREKRLEEAAQKLVDIYTSASQQELPLLNNQVSGVILQRGEACYL